VIAEAPYSPCAFFFWAATVGMLSLGFHAGGPVTAAVAPLHSTVISGPHRFSAGVSTYLVAPCARFLYSRQVPTWIAGVRFVLADLSGRKLYGFLTAVSSARTSCRMP
jgi:hypothetical protein